MTCDIILLDVQSRIVKTNLTVWKRNSRFISSWLFDDSRTHLDQLSWLNSKSFSSAFRILLNMKEFLIETKAFEQKTTSLCLSFNLQPIRKWSISASRFFCQFFFCRFRMFRFRRNHDYFSHSFKYVSTIHVCVMIWSYVGRVKSSFPDWQTDGSLR